MMERPSKRTEEDTFHVEYLLECLKNLSHSSPSPALRERLSDLCSQRLQETFALSKKPQNGLRKSLDLARPDAGGHPLNHHSSGSGIYRMAREPLPSGQPCKRRSFWSTLEQSDPGDAGGSVIKSSLPEPRHAPFRPVHDTGRRRMVVRLPYSNSAIRTGTGATIQVSISQSELLSLGFPVNATVSDRRVVADVMLGDDGLPRAISLPLPPEVEKENK